MFSFHPGIGPGGAGAGGVLGGGAGRGDELSLMISNIFLLTLILSSIFLIFLQMIFSPNSHACVYYTFVILCHFTGGYGPGGFGPGTGGLGWSSVEF